MYSCDTADVLTTYGAANGAIVGLDTVGDTVDVAAKYFMKKLAKATDKSATSA
eukprot:m.173989 g.173989  ORF g.173989 m.173989 type:complete len:53 (+) comp53287_c0_seq4:951-1109(+)